MGRVGERPLMNPYFLEDYSKVRPVIDPDTETISSPVDIVFIDSHGRRWVGRANRASDGTSIPWPFWPILGHPFDPDYWLGAYIHDPGYKDQQLEDGTPVTRAETDMAAREAWLASYGRVSPSRARTLWAGLRVGGWKTWRKYARFNDGED